MENLEVVASNTNEGLKNFIVGKMWTNNLAGNRPGAIRISRNLPADITLKPGTTLFLTPNNKREGKQDADFNVLVLLPVAVADKLIAAEQEITAKNKEAQQKVV